MTYRSLNRSMMWAVHVTKWPKRKERRKKHLLWQTGYSPKPPTSSGRNQFCMEVVCWGSSKFQLSSKLAKWFRSCRGRKLPFPIALAMWLILNTMLLLPYKPWQITATDIHRTAYRTTEFSMTLSDLHNHSHTACLFICEFSYNIIVQQVRRFHLTQSIALH